MKILKNCLQVKFKMQKNKPPVLIEIKKLDTAKGYFLEKYGLEWITKGNEYEIAIVDLKKLKKTNYWKGQASPWDKFINPYKIETLMRKEKLKNL